MSFIDNSLFCNQNLIKFSLVSFWISTLILSAFPFYGNVFNNVNAQSTGYHYSPSLTLSGSNYLDVSSKSSLQLSQFSVAAWFKTSKDYVVEAMTVNKGGVGSESLGEMQTINYL
jgi:hypothetical protein